MWLGIVIQQLVPHTGNEVEEVRVGGGFTGVIPHYFIRTLQKGGREGGREGGGRREGEGGMSDVLCVHRGHSTPRHYDKERSERGGKGNNFASDVLVSDVLFQLVLSDSSGLVPLWGRCNVKTLH